jgi:hypothetical protein
MSYTDNNGYEPRTFDDLMTTLMGGINKEFGSTYDYERFQGTNWYKFLYPLVQLIIESEADFSNIWEKYTDYIRTLNESIAIPKTPVEGLIAAFKNVLGIEISVAEAEENTAGILSVCANVDNTAADYADTKQKIIDALLKYSVAGVYTDGDQRGTAVASNGQNFEYGFWLPQKIDTILQLNITLSRNSDVVSDTPEAAKEKLINNLKNLYKLGMDFEQQKFFNIDRDAPYASDITLFYKNSKTGGEFTADVYHANFRDLFLFDPENISVVIA